MVKSTFFITTSSWNELLIVYYNCRFLHRWWISLELFVFRWFWYTKFFLQSSYLWLATILSLLRWLLLGIAHTVERIKKIYQWCHSMFANISFSIYFSLHDEPKLPSYGFKAPFFRASLYWWTCQSMISSFKPNFWLRKECETRSSFLPLLLLQFDRQIVPYWFLDICGKLHFQWTISWTNTLSNVKPKLWDESAVASSGNIAITVSSIVRKSAVLRRFNIISTMFICGTP